MEVAEEGYSKACEVRASAAYQTYVSIARASVTQIEPAYAASARLAELANTAPSEPKFGLGRQIDQLLAVLGSAAYLKYVSIHKARKMGKVPAKRISTRIRKTT